MSITLRFFFDRNISVHLARMLSHFDRVNVVLHQDDSSFPADTADTDLIRNVAVMEPKWVWVSCDIDQVRRRPDERLVLAGSEMSAVYFWSGFNSQKPRDQAIKLIRCWDNVVEQCKLARKPTVFTVPGRLDTDKVERYCLTDELAHGRRQ